MSRARYQRIKEHSLRDVFQRALYDENGDIVKDKLIITTKFIKAAAEDLKSPLSMGLVLQIALDYLAPTNITSGKRESVNGLAAAIGAVNILRGLLSDQLHSVSKAKLLSLLLSADATELKTYDGYCYLSNANPKALAAHIRIVYLVLKKLAPDSALMLELLTLENCPEDIKNDCYRIAKILDEENEGVSMLISEYLTYINKSDGLLWHGEGSTARARDLRRSPSERLDALATYLTSKEYLAAVESDLTLQLQLLRT